jgi:phospholipase C
MLKTTLATGAWPILIVALSACGGQSSSQFMAPVRTAGAATALQSQADQSVQSTTPIRHVVIIFQENRTPDYLFQGLRGADISNVGIDSKGKTVPLRPISLAAGYDLGHGHFHFETDYNNGKMNGFDKFLPPQLHLRPFGYAPMSEVKPYHDMATQYVFGDHMFQSNQGPSFPAHLYIVSGTASDDSLSPYHVASNSYDSESHDHALAGCDARKLTVVDTIDPSNGSAGRSVFPCFDPVVLSDFLDRKGVSWRYYQNNSSAGIWHAFDAVRHVRYSPDYKNVIVPSPKVLKDIAQGRLAGVSWVIPGDAWSDHAGRASTTKGPSWVAAIVNAIGESQYWKSTAIFVTWDDWGGWYDHVKPPIDNYYELGFRVPLLVISPYAKRGYVSRAQHEFGSILAFSEETFGIPKGSLGTTDRRADDLMDAFDFTQHPRVFKHITAPKFNPGPNLGTLDSEDP